jgi:hypothetical protein
MHNGRTRMRLQHLRKLIDEGRSRKKHVMKVRTIEEPRLAEATRG